MVRRGCLLLAALILVAFAALGWFAWGWYGSSSVEKDTSFIVPAGSSLGKVAQKLEAEGLVSSADSFLLRAKVLGSGDPIKAGEFAVPAGASGSRILDTLQHSNPVSRFVTVPEGMPSIMVYDRVMAEPLLTGDIPVPAEGSILPDTYELQQGESRQAVVNRMQAAMKKALAEEWKKRGSNGLKLQDRLEKQRCAFSAPS